jgi:hypothetical protein
VADSDSNGCYPDRFRSTFWEKKSMTKAILDVALWIIIASVFVLVIMNPQGFATDVSAVGGAVTSESKVLTGTGYVKAIG